MSDKKLFTKSAFKEALRCYTGMYYYGNKSYANQNNEDDFLQALADGGKQAGELARLYYGIDSTTFVDTLITKDALDWTNQLLKQDTVNIAESAFDQYAFLGEIYAVVVMHEADKTLELGVIDLDLHSGMLPFSYSLTARN